LYTHYGVYADEDREGEVEGIWNVDTWSFNQSFELLVLAKIETAVSQSTWDSNLQTTWCDEIFSAVGPNLPKCDDRISWRLRLHRKDLGTPHYMYQEKPVQGVRNQGLLQ